MPRPLACLSLLAAGFALGACTAILVPGDDEVIIRCDLSSDCPELDDNRHVAVCVLPEDLPANADKVCSSDFATVRCGGAAYGVGHSLTDTYLAAVSDPTRYAACPPALLGQRGCGPTPDGACAEGLIENVYGTCDDPDAAVFSIGAGQLELDDALGHDVQDQFCRAYFCDERFVCSHRSEQPRCVICERERFFGRAGCGVLYLQGQPSSVYLDAAAHGNCEGDQPLAEIAFGPISP